MELVGNGTNEEFGVQNRPYNLHANGGREAIFLTKVFERWQNLFGVVLRSDNGRRCEQVEILKQNTMSLWGVSGQ